MSTLGCAVTEDTARMLGQQQRDERDESRLDSFRADVIADSEEMQDVLGNLTDADQDTLTRGVQLILRGDAIAGAALIAQAFEAGIDLRVDRKAAGKPTPLEWVQATNARNARFDAQDAKWRAEVAANTAEAFARADAIVGGAK